MNDRTSNLVAQLREDLGDGALVLLVGDGRKYDPLRLKAADEIERLMSSENGVLGLMYECRDALVLDAQHAELYQRIWKWCQERQCKGFPDETLAPLTFSYATCNSGGSEKPTVTIGFETLSEAQSMHGWLIHSQRSAVEPTPCPKCKAPDSGECPCSPDEQWSAVKAAASHTTEQDFQHWLSYSGIAAPSDADLRAAFYAGANAEPPESGTPHGEAGDRAGPRVSPVDISHLRQRMAELAGSLQHELEKEAEPERWYKIGSLFSQLNELQKQTVVRPENVQGCLVEGCEKPRVPLAQYCATHIPMGNK